MNRPRSVTAIGLWWFIAVPVGGLLVGVEAARIRAAPGASDVLRAQAVGSLQYLLALALGVLSMVGMWPMRRWGVIGLSASFVLGQSIVIRSGAWSLGGLLG